MARLAAASEQLHGTEGYVVETAEGAIAQVEEIWLGPHDQPLALAVRTADGRRALLLAEQVRTVERDHRWVVAQSHPTLLELDAPRLTAARMDGGTRVAARWATTGACLPDPAPRRLSRFPRLLAERAAPAPSEPDERPVWQAIAILYGCLALIVAVVLTLAFVIPLIVTGSAD